MEESTRFTPGTNTMGESTKLSSCASDQIARVFVQSTSTDLISTTRSISGTDLTSTTRSVTGTGASTDSSPMAASLPGSGQISLLGRHSATSEPLNKVWERLKEENKRLTERRKKLSEKVASSTRKGSINNSSLGTPLVSSV